MAYIADAYGPPQPAIMPKAPPTRVRLPSIDALKGLAFLCLWVINGVTLGKATPPQLVTAPWGTVHFVDFIFPALLVAIGAGIPIAADFSARSHESFGAFAWRSFVRGFWLVVVGIAIDSAVARRPTLDMGYIQVTGIAYFIAALFGRTPILMRVFLASVLLFSFMAWTRLTAIPGSLPGTFTEKVNAVKYYNDMVFSHYGARGIVDLTPILVVMLGGSIAGTLYLSQEFSPAGRGLVLMACGTVLCGLAFLWSRFDVPLSATYWSASYTVLAMSAATVALGFLGVLFDRPKGRAIAYPFLVPAGSETLALAVPPLVRNLVLENWHMPSSDMMLDKGLQQPFIDQFGFPMGAWVYAVIPTLAFWGLLAYVYSKRQLGDVDAV